MSKVFLSFILIVICSTGMAQPYKTLKVYKPYKWMIGVHWAAIDDNGSKFERLFDVNQSWNVLAYPSRVTVDKYFKFGWSMEGALTYTQYKSGKLINDSTHFSGTFFSFDVLGKYSFYHTYAPRARWIDPYLTFGVGYTYREQGSAQHAPMVVAGGGVNFFLLPFLGIQLRSTAKFGVYPGIWETPENYLEYTAGIVYRIRGKKNTNGDFSRRKNKWIHGNKRYKDKGGGQ